MRATTCLVLLLSCWTALVAEEVKESKKHIERTSDVAPVILVADGLNADGSLIENYQRGLHYANLTQLNLTLGGGQVTDLPGLARPPSIRPQSKLLRVHRPLRVQPVANSHRSPDFGRSFGEVCRKALKLHW